MSPDYAELSYLGYRRPGARPQDVPSSLTSPFAEGFVGYRIVLKHSEDVRQRDEIAFDRGLCVAVDQHMVKLRDVTAHRRNGARKGRNADVLWVNMMSPNYAGFHLEAPPELVMAQS